MFSELCQCCLTQFCFKNINERYDIKNGKNVIYSDMIKETFNVTISLNIVCDQCIKIIQDAFNFKKLIVKSQEMQNIIEDPIIEIDIKEDIPDNDNIWDIDKKEVHIENDNITAPVTGEKLIEFNKTLKQDIKVRRKARKTFNTKDKIKTAKKNRGIREDSLNLLKYSNLCLFKSLKTKFQCYSCKETFINMSDLRNHSKIHSSKEFKFGLKGYACKKADISSLSCKLCEQSYNDLNTLRNHLENKHNIEFYTKEHIFVQYKLENGLKCVVCGQNFNTFVRLMTHMNLHSMNNVCEICGVSFIIRPSLRLHIDSVHREQKCTICSAKFEKRYAKVHHMRLVHNVGLVKRYCSLCDKNFKYSYKLTEHRIQEHGVERQKANCKECGKNFISLQNLKIHIRSVHKRERNFKCDVCGMRFFTKVDEKRHQRTHQDVKSFACSFCEGRFKSKDSWRRHIKRLHNDHVELIK